MGSLERKIKRNMAKQAIKDKGFNPNQKVKTKEGAKSRLSIFMEHMNKKENERRNAK
jgi:hypothetical protein